MYKRICTIYQLTADLILNMRGTGFLLLIVLCAVLSSFAVPSQGQQSMIFSKIAEGGFWKVDEEGNVTEDYEIHNTRAFSMAWFKGKLYVGTGRDVLALRYLSPRDLPPLNWPPGDPNAAVPVVPVELSPYPKPFWYDDGDDIFQEGEGLDTRAQIWRYTPGTEEWEMVYQAEWVPCFEPNTWVGREYGYRFMTVVEEPDGTEALYIGTTCVSAEFGGGALILRTETGDKQEDFEIVSHWLGLNPGTVNSIRSIVSLNDKLYTTPVGQFTPVRTIYEGVYEKGKEISWRPVSQEAFGDKINNYDIFSMSIFNNHIYAATLNPYEGFEIWKTDAITPDPLNPELYEWTLVVTNGAYRGPLNETVLNMCSFTDPDGVERLYVGGGIQSGGYDQAFDPPVGPGTAEIIRINADDTWELVCGLDPGEERIDPETGELILPISGLGPGFGDPFTGYFWQFEEHDGWLYVGTFDNSLLLSYLPVDEITSPELREAIKANPEILDYIVEGTGGFNLWRTQDGVYWYPSTWTGFGNHFNLGIRSLKSMGEFGIAVGVMNPFTDMPVPSDGGAQVWLGQPGDVAIPTELQSHPEAQQVKLRWIPSEDAVQYRVIRFTSLLQLTISAIPPDMPSPELVGVTTENFFVDRTVEEGQMYEYFVLADTGTGGVSGPSNTANAVAQDFFTFTPKNLVFNRATRQFLQILTVTNYTPLPLIGPVPIVLEGLTPGMTLLTQDGRGKNGSPIIYAPQVPDGGSVQILLKFSNPRFVPIKYVPFLVWGPNEP